MADSVCCGASDEAWLAALCGILSPVFRAFFIGSSPETTSGLGGTGAGEWLWGGLGEFGSQPRSATHQL